MQGTGTAPGVRAWHACTQPCPAADSLPGSRLLNPEILQFPHPQKCCHLLPDALFSFQGCCGWGGCAGSTEGLSGYLTWSSNDCPSWAKPSCSCLPPHLAESPACAMGALPARLYPSRLGKKVPAAGRTEWDNALCVAVLPVENWQQT